MPNSLTLELPVPATQADALGNDAPLRGVTVLAVEDSRFASDALRLMCRRLGARLRRADSLHAAASHLKLYRPDVVMVDLGLPDGRGEALIREVAARRPKAVVLGMSGDAGGRAAAMAAGADGFVDKPLESLAALREVLLGHLPDRAGDLLAEPDAVLVPDALALRDDLAHAAALLEAGLGKMGVGRLALGDAGFGDAGFGDAGFGDAGFGDSGGAYVAAFVRGVARHAHDAALAEASGLEEMRVLLRERLNGPDHAFDRKG